MRKIIFTAILIGLSVLVSCNKDKDANEGYNPNPVPVPNYFPMAIGNYWVYDLYKVEVNQESLTDKRDSLMITNDTIINENTFYVFRGNWFPQQNVTKLYRDSMGFIINPAGEIIFTSNINNTVYYQHTLFFDSTQTDTVYYMEYLTDERIEFVDLPIGQYNAMCRTVNYITFPAEENFPDTLKYRSYKAKFIENIGQATDAVFYASAPFHYEKRLVKYHTEEQP